MLILKIITQIIGLLALLFGITLLTLRLDYQDADGPSILFPGGKLVSGELHGLTTAPHPVKGQAMPAVEGKRMRGSSPSTPSTADVSHWQMRAWLKLDADEKQQRENEERLANARRTERLGAVVAVVGGDPGRGQSDLEVPDRAIDQRPDRRVEPGAVAVGLRTRAGVTSDVTVQASMRQFDLGCPSIGRRVLGLRQASIADNRQ